MLVFKDRSRHHISALERISNSTICSPLCQEENNREIVENRTMPHASLESENQFHTENRVAEGDTSVHLDHVKAFLFETKMGIEDAA
jgi:hypothetical protein